MKMRTNFIFILMFIFAGFSAQAQEMNKTINDERTGSEILYGYCNRDGLHSGDFGEIFKAEYKDYQPDKKLVKKIKKQKSGLNIVIVLATWCPDSQEHVPHFFKIMDEAGISEKSVKVICVDGYKQCEGVGLDNYGIKKVPTFIFFRQEKELGRIIEHPEGTLEEDILGIIDTTS